MKPAIIFVLLLGAGWALFQPVSFNIFAGAALILLGAAIITRGRYG